MAALVPVEGMRDGRGGADHGMSDVAVALRGKTFRGRDECDGGDRLSGVSGDRCGDRASVGLVFAVLDRVAARDGVVKLAA
jgi:hypothetical protein